MVAINGLMRRVPVYAPILLLCQLLEFTSAFDCRASPSHHACLGLSNPSSLGHLAYEPLDEPDADQMNLFLRLLSDEGQHDQTSDEDLQVLRELELNGLYSNIYNTEDQQGGEDLNAKGPSNERDLYKTFYSHFQPEQTQENGREKRSVLNSFSTFFKPLTAQQLQPVPQQRQQGPSRLKRDILDSFSSFSAPKLAEPARGKRHILDSFSTFSAPKLPGAKSNRGKRNILNSFSTFSSPKLRPSGSDNGRSKRDILDSFSTFSSPKLLTGNGKSKREALDLFSNFYIPMKQDRSRYPRNILNTFNGFYIPNKEGSQDNGVGRRKRNILNTFTSFYLNKNAAASQQKDAANRDKRDVDKEEAEGEELYFDASKRSNGLDSFTSFYIPKTLKAQQATRGKRDTEEDQPEDLQYENSVDEPINEDDDATLVSKRSNLDSFTSFYLPKLIQGKRESLRSFSSFYSPLNVVRPKRDLSWLHRPAHRSLLRSFTGFYMPYAGHHHDLD